MIDHVATVYLGEGSQDQGAQSEADNLRISTRGRSVRRQRAYVDGDGEAKKSIGCARKIVADAQQGRGHHRRGEWSIGQ